MDLTWDLYNPASRADRILVVANGSDRKSVV